MFVECKDWRYSCCEDRQTFADGPGMKGSASIYVISVKISGRNTKHTIHYDVITHVGGGGGGGLKWRFLFFLGCSASTYPQRETCLIPFRVLSKNKYDKR